MNGKSTYLGCTIGNGKMQVSGGSIFDGNHIILGADPEIPIPGFLVITSKRHVRFYSELTRDERLEISDTIVYAEKALKALNISQEITLVQEEQSGHFHIWILPTHDWIVEKYGKGVVFSRSIFQN